MLNIEEILKISDDMGIEIIDNTEDKHYILDECGKTVEFNVNMLMDTREESTSFKIQLRNFIDCSDIKFSNSDNLVNCENLYVSKSTSINDSIIDAA